MDISPEAINSASGHNSILTTTSCHSLSTGVAAHTTKPLPADYELGDDDVICGRGSRCFNHIGNKRFRDIVESQLHRYMGTMCKHEKTSIICEIVKQVRYNTPNGGFVKKDPETGLYYEVGDFLAREKTSQAFRDASEAYKSSNSTKKKKRLVENENKPLRKSASLPRGMGLSRSGSKRSLAMQNSRSDSFKFNKNEGGRQDSSAMLQFFLRGNSSVGASGSVQRNLKKSHSSDFPLSMEQDRHDESFRSVIVDSHRNFESNGNHCDMNNSSRHSSRHFNTSLKSIFDTDWLETSDRDGDGDFDYNDDGDEFASEQVNYPNPNKVHRSCPDFDISEYDGDGDEFATEPLDAERVCQRRQSQNVNSNLYHLSCPDFGNRTTTRLPTNLSVVNADDWNITPSLNVTAMTACGRSNQLLETMHLRKQTNYANTRITKPSYEIMYPKHEMMVGATSSSSNGRMNQDYSKYSNSSVAKTNDHIEMDDRAMFTKLLQFVENNSDASLSVEDQNCFEPIPISDIFPGIRPI